MWDWAIYGALIAGFLAVCGGAGFLVVRVLQAFRSLKRMRRHLAKELTRLADLGEVTATKVEQAAETAELNASLARLRVALAQLAVLRSAVAEAQGSVTRIVSVYPRK